MVDKWNNITLWQLRPHPAAHQGSKQSLTLHNICRTHGFLISGLINTAGAGLQPSTSEIGNTKRRQFLFYWLHDNIENFSFQFPTSKSRYPDPEIYRSCKTYLDNINNDRLRLKMQMIHRLSQSWRRPLLGQ